MYRLLIVDDVPFIVDGLFAFFSEISEPEFEVYRAYSGIEALRQIDSVKMDIVLTDIRMPKVSGLDLLDRVRKQLPKCKVIFMTGFNDFNYIQAAMRNGGFDYVLKTEGNEAILEAVRKAVKEIEREIKDQNLVEKARISLSRALPLLREKYFRELLDGLEASRTVREKQFLEMEVPLKYDTPVLLVVGKVDTWEATKGIKERMEAMYGMQSVIDEYLEKRCISLPVLYEKDSLVLFIQPLEPDCNTIVEKGKKGHWNSFTMFVQNSLESVQKACKELFGVSVSFIVSSEPSLWEDVSQKFDDLQYELEKGAGLNREMLLIENAYELGKSRMEDDGDEKGEHAIRLQLKRVSLLKTFMENGRQDEFMKLYNEMMAIIKNNQPVSGFLAAEILYSISLIFVSYLNRYKMIQKINPHINLDRLYSLGTHEDWNDIEAYFRRLAEQVFKQKQDDYLDSTSSVIGFIEEYVEKHLDEDVSLTRLADVVHFNPSYLSRLYKQSTGKSLSDYITETRILKARELLAKSDLKINEVAGAVGFDNPSYFSRVFKRYTNMTPQEYRDSLG